VDLILVAGLNCWFYGTDATRSSKPAVPSHHKVWGLAASGMKNHCQEQNIHHARKLRHWRKRFAKITKGPQRQCLSSALQRASENRVTGTKVPHMHAVLSQIR
jgi:hypothetical protein